MILDKTTQYCGSFPVIGQPWTGTQKVDGMRLVTDGMNRWMIEWNSIVGNSFKNETRMGFES